MKYAIVYSSKTGNTALLANTIRETLPAADCLYCGVPSAQALEAERIYVGFCTDKGTCDGETASFLGQITNQQVFLFGTAGFGGAPAYFEKILNAAQENLSDSAQVVGRYMCQGKMPMGVRRRYEAMEESPNRQVMLDNFDRALSHPDQQDLEALKNAIS